MNIFDEYELLELEFRTLEKKRENLRSRILEKMVDEKSENKETDHGKFKINKKITWSYNDVVNKMEEKLKIKKLYQQERGIAKAKEDVFLSYILKKHEKTDI